MASIFHTTIIVSYNDDHYLSLLSLPILFIGKPTHYKHVQFLTQAQNILTFSSHPHTIHSLDPH